MFQRVVFQRVVFQGADTVGASVVIKVANLRPPLVRAVGTAPTTVVAASRQPAIRNAS